MGSCRVRKRWVMNVITALISPVLGIIQLHLCWSQTVLSQISFQDRSQAALTITNELTPDPASHQQYSQMCTTQYTQYVQCCNCSQTPYENPSCAIRMCSLSVGMEVTNAHKPSPLKCSQHWTHATGQQPTQYPMPALHSLCCTQPGAVVSSWHGQWWRCPPNALTSCAPGCCTEHRT